jgi:hypothetical protein
MYRSVSDGYGGFADEISTSFYTRLDYNDGSFIIRQNTVGPFDRVVRFGPLKTNLSDLFKIGFTLEIEGWKNSMNQKLHLVRDKEKYKLAKLKTSDIGRYDNLVQWVKDATEPHYEPYTVKRKPKEIIKEVRVQTDPFEELILRYPVKRKPVEFIGNQTLNEYVKQQLREQRRLQNVE